MILACLTVGATDNLPIRHSAGIADQHCDDIALFLHVRAPVELALGFFIGAGTWRLMRQRHVKPAILASAR